VGGDRFRGRRGLEGSVGLTLRKRIPMKGGDEYDAFTNWRRYVYWQRGELKRIKRKYNKRVRRAGRAICRNFAQSGEREWT